MRHFYISYLALAFCLALTFGLWTLARQTVEREGRVRFETRVNEISDAIEMRMQTYVQTLYQTRGFFQSRGIPSQREFATYIRSVNITENYPGIQGIGFTLRIPAQDRSAHVAHMRALGFVDYDVHPLGERDEYHSIIMLEPFDWRNQRAFGYDMHTNPIRREAMDLAWVSGLPQVTEIVTLVQETDADRQPGFLVYLPLYQADVTPETIEERRRTLVGFVYAPFRAHDLFKTIFAMPRPDIGVDFEIYDGSISRDRLLYDRNGTFEGGRTQDARFSSRISLQVAGRSWTLYAHTLPAFDKRIANSVPHYVLGAGLILSLLIHSLFLGHSIKVKNEHLLLTEAQRELAERRRTEAKLRLSEERYRVLTETITHGVWTANANGVITYINRWWQTYTGLAVCVNMLEDWEPVVHPEHHTHFQAWMQLADPRQPTDIEVPFRQAADGLYRWHLARRLAVLDADGHVLQWVTVATDIHQIKELEEQRRSRDEELRIITDALPALISYTDAQEKLRFINAEYERWFARPLGSILGLSMDELWTRFQSHPTEERSFRHAVIQGQRVSFETNLYHSDGSLRPVSITYVPRLTADDRSPLGFFALITDLSDLRRIEQELQVNRDRFDLVTRSVHLGLWYCDLPFQTLNWNIWVKEHFFFPPDALITIDDFYERLHPSDRENTRQTIQKALDEKLPFDQEYRTVNPRNGAIKWIRAIGLGSYDQNGKPQRFDGVTLDITEQKAKEERLQQEMRSTETLYKISRSLAAELDLSRLLQTIIDSARDAIGATFGGYASFAEARPLGNFIETDLPRNPDIRTYLAVPVKTRSGAVIGALYFGHEEAGAFDDNTASLVAGIALQASVAIDNAALFQKAEDELIKRREAENKLRTLNEELEARVRDRTAQLQAANHELEAFAYSVSHDLRAPLRGIDGFTTILERKYAPYLDEQGQNYLKRVKDAASRMSHLIDDMLNLARLTRQDMQKVNFDLSTLAQSVARFLCEAEPKRQVNVRIQEGMQVLADPILMRAVLENLMGNAWKFTSHRQGGALIEVGMESGERWPVYYVKDNGAGFDMEYAEKLFRPFQRLHSAREFPGSGIGLASVQRVIHRHGGEVWAEGQVNQGAVFYFTLACSERNTA